MRNHVSGWRLGVLVSGLLLAFNGCGAALSDVVRREPLPDTVRAKLASKQLKLATRLEPFMYPSERQEFFLLKRLPPGASAIPVERYLTALEQMQQMLQHSTQRRALLPSRRDMGLPLDAVWGLGAWTALGPGNIGGRTRGLLIDPLTPTTMYAAGVAGGVWKTTNGGTTWAPLTDLFANIAVNSMAMDPTNPNVIYAGTGEGYFNGDAVRGLGIVKTTDGGATWSYLNATQNSNFHYVNKLVVSPNNSQRVYASTRTGVWRSTDGGTTWTQVLASDVTAGCLDLALRTDQTTDYLFTSCGSFAQATIFRNTDAGGAGTWTSVLTDGINMGRTSLAIAPSNQSVIYAVAASNAAGNYKQGLHAVFQSTDSGTTWAARVRNTDPTKLNTVLLTNTVFAFLTECGFGTTQFFNQGWYDNVIAVDPADPNIVWVGGIDLFRSDDGGANWGMASHWWASTTNPRYAHADQHALVFHPQYNGTTNKTLFVGNDGGLFRTDDARAATATGAAAPCSTNNGSVTWTTLNNSYGVTQFYHGVPYPAGTTYFGGTQDNGTLRGTDGAGPNNWSTLLGGDGGYVAVDQTNTQVLYAENFGLSIQKSTNGGSSWASATTGIINSGFLFITPFIMDPSDSQRLWTGGNRVWRTTNGAASWTQASTILAGSVSALAVAPTNANRVLAGTSGRLIYRTDIGLTATATTTWSLVQPRSGYVSWLTFDPANADIAYATYSTFGGTHVWRSTDGGATWTGIDGTGATGIPDVPVHSIVVDPTNTARLYVGTDVGVFVSLDSGATWAVEVTGFAHVITEALAVGSVGATQYLYAFTHGRGAWRVPTAQANITLSLSTNGPAFATGNTLVSSVTLTNPGLAAAIDFYFGAVLPDGDTIVFYTDLAFNSATGSLSRPSTLRPIVPGLDLTAPFTYSNPAFFSYPWTGTEPAGTYTLFVAAVIPKGLIDNSLDAGDLIGLATAVVTFGP